MRLTSCSSSEEVRQRTPRTPPHGAAGAREATPSPRCAALLAAGLHRGGSPGALIPEDDCTRHTHATMPHFE